MIHSIDDAKRQNVLAMLETVGHSIRVVDCECGDVHELCGYYSSELTEVQSEEFGTVRSRNHKLVMSALDCHAYQPKKGDRVVVNNMFFKVAESPYGDGYTLTMKLYVDDCDFDSPAAGRMEGVLY